MTLPHDHAFAERDTVGWQIAYTARAEGIGSTYFQGLVADYFALHNTAEQIETEWLDTILTPADHAAMSRVREHVMAHVEENGEWS